MIRAAVAIIQKDGKVLVARRRTGDALKGKWEFPGGKIKEGETPEECLLRELQEELGIAAEIGDMLESTTYSYAHDSVLVKFFRVGMLSDELELKEYDEIIWVHPGDLLEMDVPGANRGVIHKLL